jgi:polyisoprenoid-binding protein YceI
MSRLAKILIGLGVAVVVLAGAAVAGWYFFLKSDAEPRVQLKKTPVATGAEAGTVDGTYSVAPGNTENVVGYRVTEKLAFNIAESDATGRTSDVDGSLTIAGTKADDVQVTANLQTLQSDQDRRDNAIKDRGLETNTFPEATFELTGPIDFGTVPEAGETVTATATGDLTLHGVTKSVEIPVEAIWNGGSEIQVKGNLPITFSDYGIEAPSIGGFVEVQDHGEMEFLLFFTKT